MSMDHKQKNSGATPTHAQLAAYRRRAQVTPVLMHRTSNGNRDSELDFIDLCFKIISTVTIVAANGAVLLIIGNALLRYSYTDLASAAKIGGVGGIIVAPIITILLAGLKALPSNIFADLLIGFLSDFGDIVMGAMSGVIGAAILHCFGARTHGDIDAVGAAWAGALGGVIGIWRKGFNTVLVED